MPQADKKQINDNRKYLRRKRAKQYKCTVCGNDLEDEKCMMCEQCRKRAAERQRKSRKNGNKSADHSTSEV